MNRIFVSSLILSATLIGFAAHAEEATRVTITAEAVGLPVGSLCRVEVGAEYRIVEPRVAPSDRGRYVAMTSDMATFVDPAPERHAWDFVAAEGTTRPRKQFSFSFPAELPRPHAKASAGIYIPVKYTLAIPGKPAVVERETTFKIRLSEKKSEEISTCLRFEVINEGKSLRVGILPTCNHTFEELGAVPLVQRENRGREKN